MSARQRQVLVLVSRAVRQRGTAPTLRELGEALGGVSPAAVHLHLEALAKKGYLRRRPGRPRQIELLQPVEAVPGAGAWRVPIVGTIAAGEPIDAFEAPEGHVLLETGRLGGGAASAATGDSLYALRVKGDSMVDACIQDGDVVIVRRQTTAEDGDTVVALLEGEQATLKRFYREPGRVRLAPANRYYPNIYAKEVQLQGKVVGVVRYC
ncbi:MAG: transcriptional repressor LexA [Chloroflexota bacterium]